MWWLGAVCPTVDGPAAHVDHAILSIVDGLDADLVCTHVDRTDVVAQTAMTARLRREPSPIELAALEERLHDPAHAAKGTFAARTDAGGELADEPAAGHGRGAPNDAFGASAATARVRHQNSPTAPLTAARGTFTTSPLGPPDGARCVRFPGQERFTGVVPAIELVAHSAIDEVAGVGVPVGPGTLVDTMGFLRPTYTNGRLVLLVEPAAGGVLRPVEIEQPHQCCGGH